MLKKFSKEQKTDGIIISTIFIISIVVGIFVGNNTEWFRPAFATAGYMAGSLLTCVLLFSIYRIISFFLSLTNKKSAS
ncbi:hypothetical protein QA612_02220 [Evansella sp. AB-P1]|uniref:hypothetical protein n=1 Tax=Evansella sp. AB-P1 TaxID=3037653 RepID=UPI00241FACC3|nr:hypothetical protein [Evansella sp. AB-P1]MDG5786289.1 hypothetical protein [Evansella sp. AB-P1]